MIASSFSAICLWRSMTRVMSCWIFWNMLGVLYFWGLSLNTTMPSFWLIEAKISPDLIYENNNEIVKYFNTFTICAVIPCLAGISRLPRDQTTEHDWPRRRATASETFSSVVECFSYTMSRGPISKCKQRKV